MRFGVLGPVTMVDGDACATVGRSQRRGLLAFLLLNRGRWLSVDRITEALWGGAEPASARQQIQASMHAIRAELRRFAAQDVLASSGSGYRLDLTAHHLDLADFAQLVRQARDDQEAGASAEAERRLVAALELWRGPALADASGAFVESARAGLEDQRLAATEDLLAARLALGRPTEVLAALVPLLRQHPLRERLRGQQMLALYREGRQVEALEAFRTFRAALIREHGLDPHPDLQALERAILTGEPALAAEPPPASKSTVDTIVSGDVDTVDSGDPPAQLPAAASAFVGRSAELERLDEALSLGRADADRPAAVLINAIDGAGGVGKTATAVTWAHRVKDQFPDGQLYLNMHGYSTMPPVQPVEALSRLLVTLGVPPEQVPLDVDAAASLYRTRMAGRRMLVLVDNVHDVDQVRPLMPGHAGCLVLVTSRARLTGLIAREGARRVTLGGLSPDDASRLLARIIGVDRVAAEPAAAAEIARACAYLPLALRIVAANLYDRPEAGLAGYAAELTRAGRLDAFEVDGDPQASVRVALSQSYAALDVDQRRLFRLLGLVPGPDVTVSMAAALAGVPADQAAAGLERLVHSHLVDAGPDGRHAMHDLVRLYAVEQAEASESAPARSAAVARLLEFLLASMDVVVRHLYPQTLRLPRDPTDSVADEPAVVADEPADAAAALGWTEANLGTLVAAVRWAVGAGLHRSGALLADSLRGFFWVRRPMSDWFEVARAAETAGRALRDAKLVAAAELSMGMAYRAQAMYLPAVDHLDIALRASREVGWVEAEATALGSIAIVQGELCNHALTVRYLTEALELNRRIGRRAGEAVVLGNLGNIKLRSGDLAGALTDSRAALEIYREVGSPGGVAIVLDNLAAIVSMLGDYAPGLAYATEALELQEEIGDQSGASLALLTRAQIQLDLGALAAARVDAVRALELARQSQDPPREADALTVMAIVLLGQGELDLALEHAQRAGELGRVTQSAMNEAEAGAWAGRILLALGRPAEAEAYARRGLELARASSLLISVGLCLSTLAEARLAAGDLAEARDLLQEALVVQRACGHRPEEARTLRILAQLEASDGRPAAAEYAFAQASALSTAMGVA